MDRFQSLSLHESSQDDYMDIDNYGYVPGDDSTFLQDAENEGYSGDIYRGLGGSSTPLRYDSDTDEELEAVHGSGDQENTTLDTSDHESTSFLAGILSPTELGARLAVGNQLLLPAPGDNGTEEYETGYETDQESQKENKSDVDYEFDTATALAKVPPKNISVFQDKVERLFFKQDAPQQENRSFQAQLGSPGTQSLGTRSVGSGNNYHLNGVQVHHHHYYYNPFEVRSREKKQKREPSKKQRQLSQTTVNSQSTISRQLQSTPISGMSQSVSSQILRETFHPRHDIIMPQPWDRRSSPQVRTVYVLSLYLQLLVNMAAILLGAYIVYSIITTIKHDIGEKLQQEASYRLVEMAACRRAYHENQCDPETIVPAMEQACAHWQKCMNQDPFSGGNMSLVSAHTLGMIVNSLIEPLGFKVLVVVMSFTVVVFGCNFGFGYLRAKAYWGTEKR